MSQQQSTTRPRPRLDRFGWLREVISTIAFVVAVYTLLQLAIPRSVVQGRSMQPSFVEGQRLVISRLNYLFGEPRRGDIIVFNPPDHRPGDPPLIKRVIGLPGEKIEFINQQVYIDGQLLQEPYINEPCQPIKCRDESWQLGPHEYFMMGDNRNNSRDSRRFGPVPRENIIGEALFRFWPPQSFGSVQRYHFPAD